MTQPEPGPAQPPARRRRGTSPRSINAARRADQAAQAFALRLAGKPYTTIATELGCSKTHVQSLLDEAIADRLGPAEDVRDLELARLDRVIEIQWPLVEYGDPKATEVYLKALDRKAKIAGLDAPRKVTLDAAVDHRIVAAVAIGEISDELIDAALAEYARQAISPIDIPALPKRTNQETPPATPPAGPTMEGEPQV